MTVPYTLPVKFGQEKHDMHIFGQGVLEIPLIKQKMRPFLYSSQKIFKPETPILLSQSDILCNKIPVWSFVEKLIFFRNISEDRVIGFSFQKCNAKGCVEAKVLYSKGVLRPHESRAIRIQVSSFGQPCSIRLQLPCKFLDHTQYYLHKQSLLAYNNRQEEIKECFIITEKGITYPDNNVVVIPMPTNFYRIITIEVQVISLFDVDLHLDLDDQMKQNPQSIIELNNTRILRTFTPPPLSINKPLSSFIIDTTREQMKEAEKVNGDEKLESFKNMDIIKDTLQCCIFQILNSNLFRKATDAVKNSDPPYYIQLKPKIPNSSKLLDQCKRKSEILKEFINPTPSVLLASIFKELITDSIHEVFKLGPQSKNTDREYIFEDKFKTKFSCTTRQCLMHN